MDPAHFQENIFKTFYGYAFLQRSLCIVFSAAGGTLPFVGTRLVRKASTSRPPVHPVATAHIRIGR